MPLSLLLHPLPETVRQRILDDELPTHRSTLSMMGATHAVLTSYGERLGLSPTQLASVLLDSWATNELHAYSQTATPAKRLSTLLERYGYSVLTADQLLPSTKDPGTDQPSLRPSRLTDSAQVLDLLQEMVTTSYGARLPLHEYLAQYLGVPTAWLLGNSHLPAQAWPTGFDKQTLESYLKHTRWPRSHKPLLLIKPHSTHAKQLLDRNTVILAATVGPAESLKNKAGISLHITPLGTANIHHPEQRHALMAATLTGADDYGINIDMRSTSVDDGLFAALLSGEAHPDDHREVLWTDNREWYASMLTATAGPLADVNTQADKDAAKALLEQTLQPTNPS